MSAVKSSSTTSRSVLRGLMRKAVRHAVLKGSIARVYDDLQLSGDADVHLVLKSDGRDHWEHDGEVVVSNCTAAHRKFPYRVEQVEGKITRRGSLVDVAMQGRAGT